MRQTLIIQHLFQVSSLEDVSRERLEAFVESYPSYGIGHYLLSCKLQAEGSDRFLPETQRTCLYFSNPLWLQWQLQNTDGLAAPQVAAEAFATSAAEAIAPEPVATFTDAPAEPAVVENVPGWEETPAATVSVEDAPEAAVEMPVANVVTMAEEAYAAPGAGDDLAEALTAGETETVTTLEIDGVTAGEGENLATPETASDAGEPPVAEPLAGESLTAEPLAAEPTATEPSAADLLLRSIEEARGLRESVQNFNGDIAGPQDAPIRDEEAPFVLEEPVEHPEIATEEAAAAETPVVEAAAAETTLAVAETATAPAPAEPEAPPKTVAVTQDFLFEPYHTIDYFASQGIKLTLDENPTDHLGKQLKSFTDWLKTMRRLPQKDREVVPDRAAEEAIQTIAAHSVKGKDVVTETMAEVLAKQGMREKARAVYEKLSLLNPDKSAYFAAKIEQLNIP
jgi:hypothetical protein